MGQYQQWLQYREQDQQLRTDLAHLEELQQLLIGQIAQLADTTEVSQNTVIQALLATQQRAEPMPATTQDVPAAQAYSGTQENNRPVENTARGTVSPALQAWGRLPDFDTNAMQEPIVTAKTQPPLPAGSYAQRTDDTLLPSDIGAFVDSHSNTDPQLKVPWWLRNMRSTLEHAQPEQRPVDQQSTRTNQSIQRFFQRWNEPDKQNEAEPKARQQTPGLDNPPASQAGSDRKERRT